MSPVGLLIRRIRLHTGGSLKSMSDGIGLRTSELSAIENGRRELTIEEARAISDFAFGEIPHKDFFESLRKLNE